MKQFEPSSSSIIHQEVIIWKTGQLKVTTFLEPSTIKEQFQAIIGLLVAPSTRHLLRSFFRIDVHEQGPLLEVLLI